MYQLHPREGRERIEREEEESRQEERQEGRQGPLEESSAGHQEDDEEDELFAAVGFDTGEKRAGCTTPGLNSTRFSWPDRGPRFALAGGRLAGRPGKKWNRVARFI